jgi:hypothetical protein
MSRLCRIATSHPGSILTRYLSKLASARLQAGGELLGRGHGQSCTAHNNVRHASMRAVWPYFGIQLCSAKLVPPRRYHLGGSYQSNQISSARHLWERTRDPRQRVKFDSECPFEKEGLTVAGGPSGLRKYPGWVSRDWCGPATCAAPPATILLPNGVGQKQTLRHSKAPFS